MKHTKKIVGLILALACVFSMVTVTTSATEENAPWYTEEMDGVYKTTPEYTGWWNSFYSEVKDVTLKFDKGDIEISFNAFNPDTNAREYVKETIFDAFSETRWASDRYDGSYSIHQEVNNQIFDIEILRSDSGHLMFFFWTYGNNNTGVYNKFFPHAVNLQKIASPVEPFTFKQSVFSNLTTPKGEYELNISAFIHTVVNDGVNTLTLEEIKKQYITIQTINTVTGEYRVMDQNTIEGIQITAADGKATEITINGRVQTKNGKLERYVTTIIL